MSEQSQTAGRKLRDEMKTGKFIGQNPLLGLSNEAKCSNLESNVVLRNNSDHNFKFQHENLNDSAYKSVERGEKHIKNQFR